jgi:hypothetical protein
MGLMDSMKGMFAERESTAPAEGEQNPYDKAKLLEMLKNAKKESFENRWIWERTWMRNIHYINNRHWIEYVRRGNEWRDVKLAKWFPKPVTNKIGEGLQALRAMFTSVNIGVNVRPSGADPKNIAVAAVSDELAPLLHEEHEMDDVMNEHDFWFIATGNAFIHTFFEKDMRHGVQVIPFEACTACGVVMDTPAIAEAGNMCECGANSWMPATDPETGAPMEKRVPKGKGVTQVLSPFELIFPHAQYARFSDVPYVIRLRWRPKSYYMNNPVLAPQVANYPWAKAPSEQALQLFRSLPHHNDMGVAPFLGGGGEDQEGAAEYEMWVRPCDEYPEGLVFRVVGDSEPILLELEDEAIPGPLPYVDAGGQPVFTFEHSAFEQRGGRVYGTSPFDSVIQKQNQLNQLDAFVLMIINRMSNPLWLVPKGAEVEKFTGEPGLVVKWNPLTVGGNAKPERIDGLGPNASLFQIRDQYLRDIEEGLGTYDVLKGSKPAGVESFSGLQLMVERGQSRFASAFKSRGNLYKSWFKFALEIEREFGPDTRTATVLSPARTWTQKQFKNAQLQGSFGVVVEDGSNTPKTTLGIRAAVEHLNTLGFLDPNDPDQKHKVFSLFGQSGLSPSLDVHMQSALRKQQAFEEWCQSPEAQQASMDAAKQKMVEYAEQVAGLEDDGTGIIPPPPSMNATTPLAWKPWYSPVIHKQEFMKWANSDRIVELIQQNPAIEQMLTAHLMEIEMALAPPVTAVPGQGPGGQDGKPAPGGGQGQAMKNSNQESGGAQNSDGGHAGPRQ